MSLIDSRWSSIALLALGATLPSACVLFQDKDPTTVDDSGAEPDSPPESEPGCTSEERVSAFGSASVTVDGTAILSEGRYDGCPGPTIYSNLCGRDDDDDEPWTLFGTTSTTLEDGDPYYEIAHIHTIVDDLDPANMVRLCMDVWDEAGSSYRRSFNYYNRGDMKDTSWADADLEYGERCSCGD